jgi:hypothetical protein
MPSCLRTATLLRALEKVSLITLSFFFFFFLSSFLGVLGDGAGGGGFFASILSITWSFKTTNQAMVFFSRFDKSQGINHGNAFGGGWIAFSSSIGVVWKGLLRVLSVTLANGVFPWRLLLFLANTVECRREMKRQRLLFLLQYVRSFPLRASMME